MAPFSKLVTGVLSLLVCAQSVLAYSSPPSGSITVGSGGKYSTLAAALADTSSSVSAVVNVQNYDLTSSQ